MYRLTHPCLGQLESDEFNCCEEGCEFVLIAKEDDKILVPVVSSVHLISKGTSSGCNTAWYTILWETYPVTLVIYGIMPGGVYDSVLGVGWQLLFEFTRPLHWRHFWSWLRNGVIPVVPSIVRDLPIDRQTCMLKTGCQNHSTMTTTARQTHGV